MGNCRAFVVVFVFPLPLVIQHAILAGLGHCRSVLQRKARVKMTEETENILFAQIKCRKTPCPPMLK